MKKILRENLFKKKAKDLRNLLVGKINIFENFKKSLLIPKMEVMTNKMIAEYYKVDVEAIKKTLPKKPK